MEITLTHASLNSILIIQMSAPSLYGAVYVYCLGRKKNMTTVICTSICIHF